MTVAKVPVAIIRHIPHDYSVPWSCDHNLQIPAALLIDFACQKLAVKMANDDHVTVECCNVTVARSPSAQIAIK